MLVSWSMPKGLPPDPKKNHLPVQTRTIRWRTPHSRARSRGVSTRGLVKIWDRGTHECEEWTGREVKVVLNGARARGRYALIRTDGKNAPEPYRAGARDRRVRLVRPAEKLTAIGYGSGSVPNGFGSPSSLASRRANRWTLRTAKPR